MQSRSENRKKRLEKQRIILGIIILILAISITIIAASIIKKNSTKEVTAKNPTSSMDEFANGMNSENLENVEENVEQNIEENIEQENNEVQSTENKSEEKKNTSGTKYRLEVNCQQNVVNVYEKDSNGEYTNCVKVMLCSVGYATPKSGTYSLKKYGGWEWKGLQGDVYGQYATQITGNILFHSVPYTEKYNNSSLEYWEYDKLGTAASLGCIRLTVKNAKWIYDNCASGTKVYFYSDSNPGPLGKPSERKISGDSEVNGWDPTDPDSDNPWKDYDKKKNEETSKNTESKNNNTENTENKENGNSGNSENTQKPSNTETNTEKSDNTEKKDNTETNIEKPGNTENNTEKPANSETGSGKNIEDANEINNSQDDND